MFDGVYENGLNDLIDSFYVAFVIVSTKLMKDPDKETKFPKKISNNFT